MTRRLDCTVRKLERHPVTLIELVGQVDSSNAFDRIMENVSEDKPEHVAILMVGVTYINSSGCGGLIALHRAMEARNCRLFIVEPTGGVERVLRQTGCDRILRVVKSLQDVTCISGTPY